MITKKIIVFGISLFLTIICNWAEAQDKTIVVRGRVKDQEGAVLPGVTVSERGQNNRFISGTNTDLDGNFILKVSNSNDMLIVSSIGFINDTIRVNGQQFKDIVLKTEAKVLEDVVIKGTQKMKLGGMDVNPKDVLGAVSTLNMKDVEDLGASSVDEAIQGRLTNVDVTYNSGDPGAGMSIKIRNVSSLSSTTAPLIVIDDIPQQMTVDPSFNFGAASEQEFGSLLNLDPKDIETIVALFDPATTAQYGSKGGNGVLLVTTKRGKVGPARVSYSGTLTYSFQPNPMPMLNGDQYSMMIQEELFNPYGVSGIQNLTINEVSYNQAWSNYYNYNRNTDWVKEITQTGIKQTHNFSVKGGGEKAQYLYSIAYLDQVGTTLGTGLKRLTNRVNFDYKVSDKLRISADISYTNSSTPGVLGDVRAVAFRRMPNMSVYKYDANGNSTGAFFTPQYPFAFNTSYGFSENTTSQTTTYNPVAMAKSSTNNVYSNLVNSLFSVSYQIFKPLRFMGTVSITSSDDRTKQFLPQIATGVLWTDALSNKATNTDYENFVMNTQGRLSYNPMLGEDHQVSMNFEARTQQSTSYYHNLVTTNTPNATMNEVVIPALILTEKNSNSKYHSLDLVGNFNYVYKKQLKFTSTIDENADSDRGENSRWGSSYGFGLGWDVSEFAPMKEQKIITQLQFRVSWGVVGSPTGTKSTQYTQIGTNTNNKNYINLTPVVPLNLRTSNLVPEKSNMVNYGMDLAIKERIRLSVNVFSTKKSDLYVVVNLPSSAGYDSNNSVGINGGAYLNKGYDFSFNADLLKTKKSLLSVRLIFSSSVTTYTELKPVVYTQNDMLVNGNYIDNLPEINKPSGAFYGYKYLGVYKYAADAVVKDVNGNPVINFNGNPKRMQMGDVNNYQFTGGDAIYADLNHDGVINGLDVSYLGSSDPLFFGSFGTTYTYQGLTFSTLFNYRYGNKVINRVGMQTANMNGLNNQNQSVMRRWRREGDDTDIPRALYNTGFNWLGSDRFVEDGSFIRFKQVTLSYNIPSKFSNKLRLNQLKVYCTLSNIYLFTHYTGQDPESLTSSLYDDAKTPPARNVMFGLDVTF